MKRPNTRPQGRKCCLHRKDTINRFNTWCLRKLSEALKMQVKLIHKNTVKNEGILKILRTEHGFPQNLLDLKMLILYQLEFVYKYNKFTRTPL